MPEVISCPSCQRPLRIPDEMIGRPVKCPECGMVFLTVQGQGPGATGALPPETVSVPAAVSSPYSPQVYAGQYTEPEVALSGSGIVAPAIALLIVGILGLAFAAFSMVTLFVMDSERLKDVMRQQAPPDVPPDQVELMANIAYGSPARLLHGVFTGVNVLIVVGAVMALIRRGYALAVVASVLAMVNIDACCCILGLPVGIWTLVVLMRQDVRAAFP